MQGVSGDLPAMLTHPYPPPGHHSKSGAHAPGVGVADLARVQVTAAAAAAEDPGGPWMPAGQGVAVDLCSETLTCEP